MVTKKAAKRACANFDAAPPRRHRDAGGIIVIAISDRPAKRPIAAAPGRIACHRV